jgi:nitrogen fixation NifU-like protein
MTNASIPEPDLDDLYRELILDHYRHPRNKGRLDEANARSEGYNPLCGDEIEIDLVLRGAQDGKEEGVIEEIAFRGRGCSISQASGSMLTETVKGQSIAEAKHLLEAFRKLMTEPEAGVDPDLGDLEAFQGVAKFPVRVKCAMLAWRVLEDGLNEGRKT